VILSEKALFAKTYLLEPIKALKIGALLCIPLKNSFPHYKAKAPMLDELRCSAVLLDATYGVAAKKIAQLQSVNFAIPILLAAMAMVVESLKQLKTWQMRLSLRGEVLLQDHNSVM
jgi:hypothetical protein